MGQHCHTYRWHGSNRDYILYDSSYESLRARVYFLEAASERSRRRKKAIEDHLRKLSPPYTF